MRDLERENKRIIKELEEKDQGGDSKKIPSYLHASTRMKYESIHTFSSKFSVRRICRALELKPCGYYQWLRRLAKREAYRQEERALALLVRKVFEDNGQTYGYRKMQACT